MTTSPLATEDRSAASISRPRPWIRVCRYLVRRALEPMKNGRLTLHLPEGGAMEFGNGERGPRAEIFLRNDQFFTRGVLQGDIGFGEGYQAEDWDTPDLVSVIGWFCCNVSDSPTMSGSGVKDGRVGLMAATNRLRHALKRNSRQGSRKNIHAHYDLGNSFYQLWLDPTMSYSSALFEFPDQALEEAQRSKYERLCRAIQLKASDHVLEVGCGWGGFISHAVATRGCRLTAITISEQQRRFAAERIQREGLADRAEVLLMDYRDLPKLKRRFDKIVSIEMFEAVGDQYLATCISTLQQVLHPDGLLGAQFIVCPDRRHAELRGSTDWIQKHIFPGSLLLSLTRIGEVMRQTGDLWLHDLHDMGLGYAATLREWRMRFLSQLNAVRGLGFDDHFIRTWTYYLAYCEAAFAWRNITVVQAVWTRPNNRSLMAGDVASLGV